MSEENGYSNGVQLNFKVKEDLFNIRAGDGEELANILETMKVNSDKISDSLVAVKQTFLGKGVVSGTIDSGAAKASPAVKTAPDGNVRCDHGPVKDLTGQRGKNGKLYQWRFYCQEPWNSDTKCKAEDIPGNEKQV